MTSKNNRVFFEGMEVDQNRNRPYYKIDIEDAECSVYISKKIVQEIYDDSKEDKVLIAILLACIEYIRKSTSTDKHIIGRLEEDVMAKAIKKLLVNYQIETLILYLKQLKWYEIKPILVAPNPKEELEKII